MSSGYTIIVTDARSGSRSVLCHVGTNPEPVAEGARTKTYQVGRRKVRLYSNVEVVELPDKGGDG